MAWPGRLTLEMTDEGGTRPVADLVVFLLLDDRWIGPFRTDVRGEVAMGREVIARDAPDLDLAGRSKFFGSVVAGSVRALREAVGRWEATGPERAHHLAALLERAANDAERTRVYKVFISENFHRITIDVRAAPSAGEVRDGGGSVVAIGGR